MAKLEYDENYIVIKNFSHSIEDKNNGNPYNTSFELVVQSNGFSGCAFLEYDMDAFQFFVNQLEVLYDFKTNAVLLDDIYYGSKVKFSMDQYGHLELSGEIFADAKKQSLKFLFSADQTSLKVFIAALKKLVDI